MRRLLTLLVVIVPSVAFAQPGPDRLQPPGLTDAIPPPPPDLGRDTHRVMVGGGFAVFANYPMSIADEGIGLLASKPLWLGNRYRFFQWVADAQGVLGFGTGQLHAYAILGSYFGGNIYFGSVFSFELRIGLDGIAQLGKRTVGGLMFGNNAAFAFRFWKDDRKRLKLIVHQHFGGYFADDPGNDLGMNAAAFGMGLGYERPL